VREWLKEEVRVQKLKVELETVGSQTKQFSLEDIETQT